MGHEPGIEVITNEGHARQAKPAGALEARNSTAQGEGCGAAETLGRDYENKSPERAKQSMPPFQGWISILNSPRACAHKRKLMSIT